MKKPPRVALNPSLFHSRWWMKFAEGCAVPWTEMTPTQMHQRLRDWMYKKFSLDPKSRSMLPAPGMKRKRHNEACWFGFQLTDEQLEQVLRDTMETYLTERA
jgi:hypothetical protein